MRNMSNKHFYNNIVCEQCCNILGYLINKVVFYKSFKGEDQYKIRVRILSKYTRKMNNNSNDWF